LFNKKELIVLNRSCTVMAPTACVSPAELCTIKNDFRRDHSALVNHGGDDVLQSQLTAKDLVLQILKKRAAEVDVDNCGPGEEDAFYVADMGEVYRQHMRWKMNLSRVKPFYGKTFRYISMHLSSNFFR
jgi:ornithine decarboxylase